MALIDLSHTIYAGMPRIPIIPEVEFRPLRRFEFGDSVQVSELKLATHAGTHVDAPFHFVPQGKTIDQIPLEQLSGPGVVISIARGAGESISPSDFESADVRAGDIVLLYTGWDEKFESPEYHLHPYLSEEAAHWLVEKRVKMIGVDCVSPELPSGLRPQGFTFPVHHILLEHGVLIIENLANLGQIAGRRVRVYAFPLKIRASDAGHARVVAEVE